MYWLFVMHRVVGVRKDRAGLNDQEMSGLSLRVYYYCSPGDFMSDTAMYHPYVGLCGGWGTLVMNQPQKGVWLHPRTLPSNAPDMIHCIYNMIISTGLSGFLLYRFTFFFSHEYLQFCCRCCELFASWYNPRTSSLSFMYSIYRQLTCPCPGWPGVAHYKTTPFLAWRGVHRELGPRPAPWAMSWLCPAVVMIAKCSHNITPDIQAVLFAVGRIP